MTSVFVFLLEQTVLSTRAFMHRRRNRRLHRKARTKAAARSFAVPGYNRAFDIFNQCG